MQETILSEPLNFLETDFSMADGHYVAGGKNVRHAREIVIQIMIVERVFSVFRELEILNCLNGLTVEERQVEMSTIVFQKLTLLLKREMPREEGLH
jgi:hypothetical protein